MFRLFRFPSQVRPFTKGEKFPSTRYMPELVSFLDSENGSTARSQQSSLCWERRNYTPATNAECEKELSVHGRYDRLFMLPVCLECHSSVSLLQTGHILLNKDMSHQPFPGEG